MLFAIPDIAVRPKKRIKKMYRFLVMVRLFMVFSGLTGVIVNECAARLAVKIDSGR